MASFSDITAKFNITKPTRVGDLISIPLPKERIIILINRGLILRMYAEETVLIL